MSREIRDLRQRLAALENRAAKSGGRATASTLSAKPGSRRARKERRAVMAGNPNSKFVSVPEPSAVSYSINTSNYHTVTGKVRHPEFGEGITVRGRQLMSDLLTTGTGTELFGTAGTATTSVNDIRITPDRLNGRLALTARTYSRYRFRNIKIVYMPRVATSDVGTYAMGLISDGVASSFATASFGAVASMSPNLVCSFRKEGCLEYSYSGPKTWFTEYDGATDAETRLTTQFQLIGFPDATGIGATNHGWLWIEYTCELYQPTLDFGFTVQATSEEERQAAKLAIQRLRLASTAQSASDDGESPQKIIMIKGEPHVVTASYR